MLRLPPATSTLLLFAATALALVAVGPGGGAAVFGHDDRQGQAGLDHTRAPYVGLLHAPTGSQRNGSATLVAPDRILSAAHVLFDREGGLRAPLASYRFRLGHDFTRGDYREFGVARIVAVGTRAPYEDGADHLDWIVLGLSEAVTGVTPAALASQPEELLMPGLPLSMSGYHADVAAGMKRIRTSCRALAAPSPAAALASATRSLLAQPGIVFHDCDSAGLSSGAGIFVRQQGRDRLIAVNVGAIGEAKNRPADLASNAFNFGVALDSSIRASIQAP